MRFSLPSIKGSAAPPSFRLCCLNCTRRFDLITVRSLGSSRKLEGNAEYLIDGSEKRICRLRFEFFTVRVLLKSAVKPKKKKHHTDDFERQPFVFDNRTACDKQKHDREVLNILNN